MITSGGRGHTRNHGIQYDLHYTHIKKSKESDIIPRSRGWKRRRIWFPHSREYYELEQNLIKCNKAISFIIKQLGLPDLLILTVLKILKKWQKIWYGREFSENGLAAIVIFYIGQKNGNWIPLQRISDVSQVPEESLKNYYFQLLNKPLRDAPLPPLAPQTPKSQGDLPKRGKISPSKWYQNGFDIDDIQERLEYFQNGINQGGEYAVFGWFGRGMACEEEGDLVGAISAYNTCSMRAPGYPNVWYQLGMVYEMCGQWDNAILTYEKALNMSPKKQSEIVPSLVMLHMNLGFISLEQENLPRALREFEGVLKLEPNNVPVKTLRDDIKDKINETSSPLGDKIFPRQEWPHWYYEYRTLHDRRGRVF